jgi:probable phosphoglycerate mutase
MSASKTETTRLLVMRHGETEANAQRRYMGQDDSPLTSTGRQQVKAASARLGDAQIDAIYASDLLRAARTAEAIAAAVGRPIRFDRRLRERDSGILQGLVDDEARARHPEVFRQLDALVSDYAIPGGESADQVRQRVAVFVRDILDRHPAQNVLAVTHGGIARALIWHLLDVPYASIRWARCDNTSLSSFVHVRGAWALETWNDTAHLRDRGNLAGGATG